MRLIAALLCLMASVPAQAAPVCVDAGQGPSAEAGGVGGTGHGPGEGGGIGGTGAALAQGIGGTGARRAPGARLGVVGVITGFGSLCVNGLRLQYDSSARISENGRDTGAQALAVGQFVSVEVERMGDALLARDIGIVQLLEGPLSASPEGGRFEVMGQPVRLLPDAQVQDGGASASAGRPGQGQRHAGARRAGACVAHRTCTRARTGQRDRRCEPRQRRAGH